MNETQQYFTEAEEPPKQEELDAEDYSFLEGICGKCLDTGFVHDVRDGVLGVLFTSMESDSNGQPVKRLMVCDHGQKVNC